MFLFEILSIILQRLFFSVMKTKSTSYPIYCKFSIRSVLAIRGRVPLSGVKAVGPGGCFWPGGSVGPGLGPVFAVTRAK